MTWWATAYPDGRQFPPNRLIPASHLAGPLRAQGLSATFACQARASSAFPHLSYSATSRFRASRTPDFSSRIEAPTLLIWGDRDPHLVPDLTVGLERWVPNLTVAHLPEASHWVLADAPDEVEKLVVNFLP